jgi:preprotein translocase subunit SecA
VRALDRGTLARIDRNVLAGLGHDETWQMVRVPAGEAMWLAWKRYCDSLGLSMGRGVAALIQHELRSVVDDSDQATVFIAEREAEFARRQGMLVERERNIEIREQRLRAMTQRQTTVATPRPAPEFVKVGRNDACPCGSGVKYKRCHGS